MKTEEIKFIVWEGDNQFDIEDILGIDEIETGDSPDTLLIPINGELKECDLGDTITYNDQGAIGVQRTGAYNNQ